MNLFSSLDISSSALSAQRVKMDMIATNIANIETTDTPDGGPYKKRTAIIREKSEEKGFLSFKNSLRALRRNNHYEGQGVEVSGVIEDENAVRLVHIPNHPRADSNGNVRFPDINIIDEMVEMIKASRLFEANLTALSEAKSVLRKSLEIGKG
jgi:flagellar basal-body rod protein FlgC